MVHNPTIKIECNCCKMQEIITFNKDEIPSVVAAKYMKEKGWGLVGLNEHENCKECLDMAYRAAFHALTGA